MQPGPRPLPKNITVLRGSRAPRTAVEQDKQPDPVVKLPATPEDLSPEEAKVFERMARKLVGMRVMSEMDVEALSIYAVAETRMKLADRKMKETSEVVKGDKGRAVTSPWWRIFRECERTCNRVLEQFGCTPSGRTRVSTL